MHLFVAMAFFIPVVAATSDLKQFGGGTLRYVVAIPAALMVGALVVSTEWKLGKSVWRRCQRYSPKAQNLAAMSLFALQLLWIVIGAVFGTKLAAFLVAHIAP